jgi:probable biosynthetic protein (TIGR04098 family)
VYFAKYVAFMDTAERIALAAAAWPPHSRSLRRRRIAYYGNADVDDTLIIAVTVLRSGARANTLGFKYTIRREEDGETICLSEAIKAVA